MVGATCHVCQLMHGQAKTLALSAQAIAEIGVIVEFVVDHLLALAGGLISGKADLQEVSGT